MENEVCTSAQPTPGTARRSSTATKLVQAAALAAVLVPLGTVAVETSTINCANSYSGCVGTFNPANPSNDFDFGGFSYILTLENVMSEFTVDITANFTNQGFLADQLINFPGAECVPMIDPSTDFTPCVDFGIFPSVGPSPDTWLGFKNKIAWDFDTNTLFPNDAEHQIVILHDFGSDFDQIYDENMCAVYGCTYFPGPGDPGISSGDTDFQHHLVASLPTAAAVPEPATMILVGSGLGGFLYRRRRRRCGPGGGATT